MKASELIRLLQEAIEDHKGDLDVRVETGIEKHGKYIHFRSEEPTKVHYRALNYVPFFLIRTSDIKKNNSVGDSDL